MATNLDVHVNVTATDTTRVANPSNWVQMDISNDKLIWSACSAAAPHRVRRRAEHGERRRCLAPRCRVHQRIAEPQPVCLRQSLAKG